MLVVFELPNFFNSRDLLFLVFPQELACLQVEETDDSIASNDCK
jgi:hypothetical protein